MHNTTLWVFFGVFMVALINVTTLILFYVIVTVTAAVVLFKPIYFIKHLALAALIMIYG